MTSETTETGLTIQPEDFIGGEDFGNNRNFDGTIDEVRVYDTELTEKQLDVAMFGPPNCFEQNELLMPGSTYNCSTGVGIPDSGEAITFSIHGPENDKTWKLTCFGSRDAKYC